MESVNRIKEILNGMNIKKGEYSTKLKINKKNNKKTTQKIIRKDGKQERNENMVERFQFNSPFVIRDLVVLKQKNKY
jgi:translation elongation factor EF-1alpha